MKVYMAVGLPGSGKTTIMKKDFMNDNTVVVSRDSIREMLSGGDYGRYWSELSDMEGVVRQSSEHILLSSISNGRDVIIDETSFKKSMRKRLFEIIEGFVLTGGLAGGVDDEVEIVAVHVITDKDECIRRRLEDPKSGSHNKWEEVINSMYEEFEAPEKSEGFSEVITYCQ